LETILLDHKTIPLAQIRISASNVRADEPFGDEEDQSFVENVGTYGVMSPIYVRPVGDNMYEVYSGRRRYLAAKESGLTEISCIVKDVDDLEAFDLSVIENFHRKNVNPMVMGRAIRWRREREGISFGKYSKMTGISKTALFEYDSLCDLSPAMQNEVQRLTVPVMHALKVLRMNLPPEVEDTLAEEAKADGLEVFKRSLDRIAAEQEKRGAPTGLKIIRISWGFESPEYEALKRRAEEADIELGEYCQRVLKDHLKEL